MLKRLQEGYASFQQSREAKRQERWHSEAVADYERGQRCSAILIQVERELLPLFEGELKAMRTPQAINDWIKIHEPIFVAAGLRATRGEVDADWLRNGWLHRLWSWLRHDIYGRHDEHRVEQSDIVRQVTTVSRGELVQPHDQSHLAAELGIFGPETEVTGKEMAERVGYDYPALGRVFAFMSEHDLVTGLAALVEVATYPQVEAELAKCTKNPLGINLIRSAIEVIITVPFRRALRHATYSVAGLEKEIDSYKRQEADALQRMRDTLFSEKALNSARELFEEDRYAAEVLAALTTGAPGARRTELQSELISLLSAVPAVDRERLLQARTLNRLNQVREMMSERIQYFGEVELSEGKQLISLPTVEELNALRRVVTILDMACERGVLGRLGLGYSDTNPSLEDLRRHVLPKNMEESEQRLSKSDDLPDIQREKKYYNQRIRDREGAIVHAKNYEALTAVPDAELYQLLRKTKLIFNLPYAWDEQLFSQLKERKFLQKPNKTTLERLAGEFLEG